MATFDDDFLRLHLLTQDHPVHLKLQVLRLEWPPPEKIVLGPPENDQLLIREAHPMDPAEVVLHRVSMSQISDEQRFTMTNVARGAEYRYEN